MGDSRSSGKRKTKPRDSYSSSGSESPLDKRQRETTSLESQDEHSEVFEDEPRGEDEASLALDMNVDVTSKLDQILAKLAKLDAIEASLNEFRQKMIKVESEVSILKDSAGEATKRLDEMDSGMQWLNTEVNDIEGKIKDLGRSKEDLHTKQLYAELYSRRENVKFNEIQEKETRAESDGEKVNTRDILIDLWKMA